MTLSALKRRELTVMALCSLLHGDAIDADGQLSALRCKRAEQDLLMDQCKVARRWALLAVDQALGILALREEFRKDLDAHNLDIDWKRLGRVEEAVLLWFLHSIKEYRTGSADTVSLGESASFSEAVRVLISEGIRLVRKFSSRESGGYINVLLDRYCHKQDYLS